MSALSLLASTVLTVLGFVILGSALGLVHVARMTRKQKKLLLKRRLRHVWRWLEERGLSRRIRP